MLNRLASLAKYTALIGLVYLGFWTIGVLMVLVGTN